MSQPTPDQILEALRGVQDPDLNRDIVSLGFVKRNTVEDGRVSVTINLTTPACPVKDQMKEEAERLIRAIEGVVEVSIEMTAVAQGAPVERTIAPEIRHILAVSSGKGGVGKSTVTVNLACALARTGARVGVLDCDVYGPDIPIMMGLAGQPDQRDGKLVPKERHGVKTMSIGYLLDDEKPVIWRGPMVHKLIEQFLGDVQWEGLDYLLVDMPPGTGDAQLSLAQLVPLSGTVLVTTPQAVSTFDVGKAIGMFRQVNVDILGIVENMSGLTISGRVEGASGGRVLLNAGLREEQLELAEDGSFSTVVDVFGTGGAELLANKHGFPLLGRVPLDPAVRVAGDGGDPVVITAPESAIALSFKEIAGLVARRLSIREHAQLPVLQ